MTGFVGTGGALGFGGGNTTGGGGGGAGGLGGSNVGGFQIWRGRPESTNNKIAVICDPAITYLGLAANDGATLTTPMILPIRPR